MSDSGQSIQPTSFTPLGEQGPQKRRRIGPLQAGLAAVLLLFALSMLFLFTARSILFTFDPVEAEISISGGLQLKLGGRTLLRPGEYQVSVTAEGHYPLEQELEIGNDEQQTFHFRLQRLPGKLSFDSQPAGATVLIDGEPIGETPLIDMDIAAGSHELSLRAQRYLPYRGDIEVEGMGRNQSFDISLDPAWANIAISSEPVGATVFVDGEAMGVTPALLEILEGEHQIMLSLPRFQDWQQNLSVSAGVHQNLEPVVLQPAEGIVHLSTTPSAANVTLDGEYQGQTPISLSLSPGKPHRVAVFKPGHSSASRTLTMEPKEERELTLNLKPQLGEVLIQVQPADASIRIDGTDRGNGSQTLSLPAFEQTLEVSREGYRSHRQRFTPRTGLGQIINVKLLTEKEARLAALKPQYTTKGGQIMSLFTPGNFTMGASRREPGRRANEILHPVSLTRMFYFSHREVSNAEFRKFRKEHNSGRVEGNSLNRDRQPAVMVSWNDAAVYCNWLSEKEELPPFYAVQGGQVVGFNPDSHGYRLPSEAEWAWIARSRGDKLLKYPWGDGFPPTDVLENYADHSSSYITGRTVNGYNDGQIVSAPTASFKANERGIYDMGGNVAEWVHDVYALPETSGAVAVDPLGAQNGNNHVIRGASWAHGTVTELRLSFRDYGKDGRDDVGFRIARYAEEKP